MPIQTGMGCDDLEIFGCTDEEACNFVVGH